MWKKLISLNLTLLLLVGLLPIQAAAADAEKVIFFKNDDTEENESRGSIYLSSWADLILYDVVPYLLGDGEVVTSYNSEPEGNGQPYRLTSFAGYAFSTYVDESNHANLYAQWKEAADHYILYVGKGTGGTQDGADYVLQDNLNGTATLKGDDTFLVGGNRKIIGWTNTKDYYVPGQEISIEANLSLIPIVGVNYIMYHYTDENGKNAQKPEFYYSYNDQIGRNGISQKVVTDTKRLFVGWNDKEDGSGNWRTGSVKDAPHELYAWYADCPNDKEYCILYNWLGFENGEMCKTCPLIDNLIGDLPTFDDGREGYTFQGWYTEASGGTQVDTNTSLESGDIIYARWTKTGASASPEDKSYHITFDAVSSGGGGVLYTDMNGKITQFPTPPTWEGYTFDGWYTAAEGGEKVDDNYSFTSNITVYAHWTSNGGTTTPGEDGGNSGDNNNPGGNGGNSGDNNNPGGDGGSSGDNNNPGGDGGSSGDNNNPGGNDDDSKTVTITFELNGGTMTSTSMTVAVGETVTLPEPTRDGYKFEGWFTTSTGGEKVGTTFSKDSTLYAQWSAVNGSDQDDDNSNSSSTPSTPADPRYRIYAPSSVSGGSLSVNRSTATEGTRVTIDLSPRSGYVLEWLAVTSLDTGRDITLTERDSGEYTFIMPAGDVEVEVSYISRAASAGTYSILPQAKPGPNAWYLKDVHIYHVTDGLVPDSTPITRDMLISVLYNMTEVSVINSTSVGSETNDAQVWATNNGIVPDIYASGLWGLDKPLSREQAAMLIFGYAGYRGCNVSQTVSITQYTDHSRVRPAARSAMSWVLATGLMTSTSAATLSPQSSLTCGQAGDILFRFQTSAAWTR